MAKRKPFMGRVERGYAGFVTRYIDSFIPEDLEPKGSSGLRRARILVIFSSAVVVLAALMGIAYYVVGSQRMAVMCLIAFTGGLSYPVLLRLTKRLDLAAGCFILCVFTPMLINTYLMGGMTSNPFRWVLTIPLWATLVGGRRVGLYGGVFAVAVTGAFYGLERMGVPFPSSPSPENSLPIILASTLWILLTVWLLSFIYEAVNENTQQQLEESNAALRKESEEHLLLKEHFEKAQEVANVGSWEWDIEGNTYWWSDQQRRMHGFSLDQEIPTGREAFDVVVEEDRERVREVQRKAIREATSFQCMFRIAHPALGQRTINSQCMVVRDDTGRPVRLMGTSIDITDQLRREEKVTELNQQLLETSRQAGQAEVATGVLHNMGNALSTLNTSLSLLRGKADLPALDGLEKAARLLDEHREDLVHFLTEDERGRRLPEYLQAVVDHFANEKYELGSLVGDLGRSIDHVNMIIALQQTYARNSSFREAVNLHVIIDEALRINAVPRDGIELIRQQSEIPEVVTDHHRVLQILVALIRNALDAVKEVEGSRKQIVIEVRHQGDDQVFVEVSDSGSGIAAEDLERIFSFGFTTKVTGHGFGLHNAALSAKMLGGFLEAASAGPGKGATFRLALPISYAG